MAGEVRIRGWDADTGTAKYWNGTAWIDETIQLVEDGGIILDAALSADGKCSGITEAGTAGAALAFGDIVYQAVADSRWELAKADAAATAFGKLGICVLAAAGDGSATTILLWGKIRADAVFPALTIGAPVYLSAATAGDIVVTAPTGSIVRTVGYGNTADELYFCPDLLTSPTGRTATYVVAASDAPAHVKAQADYVCDGTDDDVQLNAALTAAGAQGITKAIGSFYWSANPVVLNELGQTLDITGSLAYYSGTGNAFELANGTSSAGGSSLLLGRLSATGAAATSATAVGVYVKGWGWGTISGWIADFGGNVGIQLDSDIATSLATWGISFPKLFLNHNKIGMELTGDHGIHFLKFGELLINPTSGNLATFYGIKDSKSSIPASDITIDSVYLEFNAALPTGLLFQGKNIEIGNLIYEGPNTAIIVNSVEIIRIRNVSTNGIAGGTVLDAQFSVPTGSIIVNELSQTKGQLLRSDLSGNMVVATTKAINAGNDADGNYFTIGARDSDTDAIVEVGRIFGAADPYFSFGGSQQHKFYNSGAVSIGGVDGLDINPGSDVNADLITVGVTGAPTIAWVEANDRFSLNKSIIITGYVSTSSYVQVGDNLVFAGNATYMQPPDTDANYIRIMARDSGVGLVEVARFTGAADPEFQTGLNGNAARFSYAGYCGFFGTAPQAKPTGVAVTAEGIHAALVTLGLIAA